MILIPSPSFRFRADSDLLYHSEVCRQVYPVAPEPTPPFRLQGLASSQLRGCQWRHRVREHVNIKHLSGRICSCGWHIWNGSCTLISFPTFITTSHLDRFKSRSPLDLYKQVLNVKFTNATITLKENEQYLAPMVNAGSHIHEQLRKYQQVSSHLHSNDTH